ncbi:hypothetical protein QJS10_CPA09g01225 [Acorus calamus]|uniref:Adenosine deaminase domain-containing protein n=1 Tax=Acorus calamus TaxID=4465 RepID=A0AAV9E7J3_ACOCL|nr:hypothetical protein QJS10_CPA09g01225 [Acorus calamus]
MIDMEWCRSLPKIELHAHLNGSIRDSTLLELAKVLGEKNVIVFSDVEHIILKDDRSLQECFRMFDLIHVLATDHTTIKRIAKEVVEDFAAENVVYLELRTTPKKNEAIGMSKQSYMKAVIAGIKSVETVEVEFIPSDDISKKPVKTPTIVDSFRTNTKKIYVRLLLSIDRRETTAAAVETVELASEMKDSGVVGIDLSGNPCIGEWLTVLPALKRARELELPITLHCGEVPNHKEIQAMLEFRPQRIGHAIFLKEDQWKTLRSSNIPVEICLSSNVQTQCVPSYDDHHFIDLYNAKHPLILCTDDPGMFSTSLSREYYIAAKTFGLSKSQLHEMAMNAITYAFADGKVKKALEEIFKDYERKLTHQ